MGRVEAEAVLVALPIPFVEDDARQAPGGLVSIATYAGSQGYRVAVCDFAGVEPSKICAEIPDAEVYGFGLYSVTYGLALRVLKELRQRSPRSLFVAGGPHASALPDEVAQHFDCVICGEGERAFTFVLSQFREGNPIPRIVRAAPIDNLDGLPFPEFHRYCEMTKYTRSLAGRPVISLDSSRGCNFRCRFCNSRTIERGCWRARSPESVAAEVQQHCSRGWNAFRFNDDNFAVDRSRAMAISRLLRSFDVRFRIFARAEDLTDGAFCRALVEAGCLHVGVGVESLSSAMLARMGKATQVRRIRDGVRTAHDNGIMIRGFFIVGFPGETNATVQESIAALGDLPLDDAVVYPCIPYPGSDLFERPDYYGITWIDPDFSHYIQVGKNRCAGFVMRTRDFGPDQVRLWREKYMSAFRALGFNWSDEGGVAV
jgi:radical SAM superfamily enzyme YgiQ (UPF0313 family)